MAETPTFGEIYHTKDGKTVFVDSKSGQVSVFEGILTIDKILEPSLGLSLPMSNLDTIIQKLLADDMSDLIMPAEASNQAAIEATGPDNILGPKDYYILVSSKQLPLGLNVGRTTAWVSEWRNGHHPEYQGYHKHQILSDQWKWLINDHKECPIMAWYDAECPAFVTLACQAHAKIIKPVRVVEEVVPVSEASPTSLLVEIGSIQTVLESVLTEERDV